MTGRIVRLVIDKGFGFIKGTDNIEYFFHRSGVRGDFNALKEQESVTFEVEPSPKGPRATEVSA